MTGILSLPRATFETGTVPAVTPEARRLDADAAVTALYTAHYRSLVRLAALLLDDVGASEEVVQDAYVKMHGAWRRIREPEAAVGYLRTTVVNLARSRLRHRQVVQRHAPKPMPDAPSAEHGAMALLERDRLVRALRTLPTRQRECLVLRYYGDLSEVQIAEAMGISTRCGEEPRLARHGGAALGRALERVRRVDGRGRRELEALLRQALADEAGRIEPAGDGLRRIRERTRPAGRADRWSRWSTPALALAGAAAVIAAVTVLPRLLPAEPMPTRAGRAGTVRRAVAGRAHPDQSPSPRDRRTGRGRPVADGHAADPGPGAVRVRSPAQVADMATIWPYATAATGRRGRAGHRRRDRTRT